MIGKIVTIGLLVLNTACAFYKAGKYANGGKDVHEGNSAAAGSIIGAFISALLAAALYLDW